MQQLLLCAAAGALAGIAIWRVFASLRPTHHDVEARMVEDRKWRDYRKTQWDLEQEALRPERLRRSEELWEEARRLMEREL